MLENDDQGSLFATLNVILCFEFAYFLVSRFLSGGIGDHPEVLILSLCC